LGLVHHEEKGSITLIGQGAFRYRLEAYATLQSSISILLVFVRPNVKTGEAIYFG
jgi:hypothetical protein